LRGVRQLRHRVGRAEPAEERVVDAAVRKRRGVPEARQGRQKLTRPTSASIGFCVRYRFAA
jgi:hypothetical protein